MKIEIDPALLVRDGREYEVVGFRAPEPGDWYLSLDNRPECSSHKFSQGVRRLILRAKRWVPKEGEECIFLDFDFGPQLKEERWTGCNRDLDRFNFGCVWPLSRRAEAEACVERVKKAIGGEA